MAQSFFDLLPKGAFRKHVLSSDGLLQIRAVLNRSWLQPLVVHCGGWCSWASVLSIGSMWRPRTAGRLPFGDLHSTRRRKRLTRDHCSDVDSCGDHSSDHRVHDHHVHARQDSSVVRCRMLSCVTSICFERYRRDNTASCPERAPRSGRPCVCCNS